MKNTVLFLLLLITVSCGSTDHYHDAAKDMASKIPEGSRVANKITSPEKNGLPEVFLQKLMAEFSGALVKISDSKFIVLSRNSTEEIWKEAIEFSNQETDKITASAEADIIIMLSPKINEGGIDLSFTAYSLREGSTGNILSSTNKFIPMNVKAELGVDVKALDKKIDQLGQLLDKNNVVKTNELIEIFNSFAAEKNFPNVVAIDDYLNKNFKDCGRPAIYKFNTTIDSTLIGTISHEAHYGRNFNYELSCDLYHKGKNIANVNAESDGKTRFLFESSICCGGTRTLERVLIHPPAYNSSLYIPEEIFKKLKYLTCTGGASDGEDYYQYLIPGKEAYYIHDRHTSGTAGQDIQITLFRDASGLPDSNNHDYSKKWCTDKDAYWEYLDKKVNQMGM
jgi:hypothetical protein